MSYAYETEAAPTDAYYGQQKAAAASLNRRTEEPRLTALANRLNVLDERASETLKRLHGELDRICGPRPEADTGVNQALRGDDMVALIERNVDRLEATISDIFDHVGRLSGL